MSDTYIFSIKSILKSLEAGIAVLNKAQTWAKEQGVAEEKLLSCSLYEDMLPLKYQVTITSDNAKGLTARLSGTENPVFDDNITDLTQAIDRFKKTIDFIKSIDQDKFAEANQQKIVLPYYKDKYQTAEDYMRDFAIPNFYFHLVTMYNILRNQGVPLGKNDYLTSLNLQDL